MWDLDVIYTYPNRDHSFKKDQPVKLLFSGAVIKSKGVEEVVEPVSALEITINLIICGNHKNESAAILKRPFYSNQTKKRS